MKSATTASTEIPQPAMAIPVCPVGTKTEAMPRPRASRSSSSETVIFPIAQSEPTVSTVLPAVEVRPAGHVEIVRRAAQIGQRGRRERVRARELRIVADELVQAVLDADPVDDAVASSSRQAGGNLPPWVATPTSAAVGCERQSAPRRLPTIGTPSSFSPARVESRIATTSSRR